MVALKVHDPEAGKVKLVLWVELPAPATATGVAPGQVELALGAGAWTRPGR